ncbi:MAG: TetR family transcriptional regulator, partial [Myxococcales bacterium]|nr:TetR family transcriptional regulator [Myxococcales bacterium]
MNQDPKDRILKAAIQLWAEKGYDQATMRELARRVGMNASGLYQHFAGKEAIVQHFYTELNAACRAAFDVEGPSGDVGADLERFLRLKLSRLDGHRSAATGLLREAIDPGSPLSPLHPDSDDTLRGNIDTFAAWVEHAGLATGPAALDLARGLWLLHIGVLVFWLHDTSEGAVLTDRLLQRVRNLGQVLPFLGMVPGAGGLFALFGDLLDARRAPVEVEPARTDVDEEVDVLVIGGGPIGCLTAGFLKQQRPSTRVVVLEASDEPAYKVGESTLSGFCKALRTLGIRQEALQALFTTKNGLGFTWAGEGRHAHDAETYVLETFDETFQVERRPLELLLHQHLERMGIE